MYFAGRSSILLIATTGFAILFLTACSDPAPGEGMEKPLARKPLPEVVSAREALQTPDLTTVDPATMDKAEIEKVVPRGPWCSFAYTAESPPVLTGGMDEKRGAIGVVKLHGRLVELNAKGIKTFEGLASGAAFSADGIRLTVIPESNGDATKKHPFRRWTADMIFELDQSVRIGYRGWYTCQTSQ